jgi:hypothetical protein
MTPTASTPSTSYRIVVVKHIKRIVQDSLLNCTSYNFDNETVTTMMTKIGSVSDLKKYIFEDYTVTACLRFEDYRNITVTLKRISDDYEDEINDVWIEIVTAL